MTLILNIISLTLAIDQTKDKNTPSRL